MAWWIYKCNARNNEYQNAYGDWDDFFKPQSTRAWGSTEWIPSLGKLRQGDTVIAYQTDRNELVGVATVRQSCRRDTNLYLTPTEQIGVKVRPLKKANRRIAAIPALQSGPIMTIYSISASDGEALLRAARAAANQKQNNISYQPETDSNEQDFLEGEKRAIQTTVRNTKLRAAAKRKWGVRCYCCGFDFETFYGPRASECAIVHHLKPFTTNNNKQRKTTVKDVRVVCANCHYVIHRTNPPMSVNKMRQLISRSWNRWTKYGVSRKKFRR